jgi:Flp pilus assembly protein TadG
MSSLLDRARAMLRRLGADRGGFSAVLTALALTILIGFIGLGIDVGVWQWLQRDMQEAADHAAFAAASEFSGSASSIQNGLAVAINGLGLNGATFTANAGNTPSSACYTSAANNTLKICVDNLLSTGAYNNLAWQVVISQPRPMWFSRILFSQSGTISASAIATPSSNQGHPCAMALSSNAQGAFTVNGNSSSGSADATFTNCDVTAASTATNAVEAINGAAVSALHLYTNGGEYVDSGSSINPAQGTTQNQSNVGGGNEFQDPYGSSLTSAIPTGCDYNFANGGNQGPGVYCGSDFAISASTPRLTAGLYVLWGVGLSVTGGTLTATCPNGETYASSTGTCNNSQGVPTSDLPTAPWSCSAGGNATSGVTFYLVPSNTTLQTIQQQNPNFAGTSATNDSVQISGCLAITAPRPSQFSRRTGCIGTCSLSLPSGTPAGYEGLAIWIDRSMSSGQQDLIGGGAAVGMQGALYDPNRTLVVSGSGDIYGSCTQIIANQISISGPTATNSPPTMVNPQYACTSSDPVLSWPIYSTLGPVALTE